MKALVYNGQSTRLEERGNPRCQQGEVVLDVLRAGICNTDLEIARGYMGFQGVLGHEIVGDVAGGPYGGSAPGDLQGKRAVVEINCPCNECATCRAGNRNHCPNRTVIGIQGRDGGLAERVAVPVSNLHMLPREISDDAAVFVEPLAAALHAFDEAALKPGDRVLLLGDGKLGLLVGLALATRQGDLGQALAVGHHADKLAILEDLGIDVTSEDAFADVGFDVVIDATGQPSGLSLALAAVRPRGTVVVKSTFSGAAEVDLSPVVINEIKLIGSRCGEFSRAIGALASGRIDPTPLLSHRFPISAADHAFAQAAEPGVMKVVVQPE